jgi:NADH dehydrogenase [ubiquinone] 1 alpha subcomplex assembly factor 7
MRQCLTSDQGGYYTRQTSGHDQFGTKGDFITSPEISQVFGELVGIWLYTEWLAQGRKEKVQIIEVGPGRGTLMDDVLRTISSFKPFAESVEAIYMIEASDDLRQQQAKRLSGTEAPEEYELGWRAPCKYIPNCTVNWCEDIRFVPKGILHILDFDMQSLIGGTEETSTPFILAHEFFDALPIHVFQNVANSTIPAASKTITQEGAIQPKTGPQAPKNQWHELVVAPIHESQMSQSPSEEGSPPPEFHLTVSKSPTPHSLYLPRTSPRYQALQNTTDAIIEISPESLSYISDFAVRIGGANPPSSQSQTPIPNNASINPKSQPLPAFQKPNPSGAALILDYGPASTIPANTLRGIRSHQPCSPFVSAGLVDISADVDFVALADAALDASPGVEVHGPVEQAYFLSTLGILERAERLLKATGDEETRERLETAVKRLVDRGPTGMGRIYKALAVVPFVEGKAVRRPVGFGGGVFQ